MPLHEQIRAALIDRGWSVAQLKRLSGLALDRSRLQRKLTGRSPMRTSEVERIVETIRRFDPGFEVRYP